MSPCVFCRIIAGTIPAEHVAWWDDAMAFRPLNPVNPGHVLVIPTRHVRDAAEDPDQAAATMRRAATLAGDGPCNLITSRGPEATQTVFHLHIHVVPRREGDGLSLPWTNHTAAKEGAPL